MIKCLLNLCLLLLLPIVLSCGGSNGDNTAQIDGFFYSFDESGGTIIDYSGNNYHGDPQALSRVTGKVGGAIRFISPGSNIELTRLYNYCPFMAGFTFRAWIKIEQPITTRQQIIGGWTVGETHYPINNFGISLIDDRLSFEVAAYPSAISVTTDQLNFPIDQWFHVAITYDMDQIKCYYNGTLVATDSILTTFKNEFLNQIGHNYRSWSGITILDQFFGYLDELYLEETVMSDAEILDYYNSTN